MSSVTGIFKLLKAVSISWAVAKSRSPNSFFTCFAISSVVGMLKELVTSSIISCVAGISKSFKAFIISSGVANPASANVDSINSTVFCTSVVVSSATSTSGVNTSLASISSNGTIFGVSSSLSISKSAAKAAVIWSSSLFTLSSSTA